MGVGTVLGLGARGLFLLAAIALFILGALFDASFAFWGLAAFAIAEFLGYVSTRGGTRSR